MKILAKLMIVACTGLAVAPAQAATSEDNAQIVQLRVDAVNDTAVIRLNKIPTTGRPGCATYAGSGYSLAVSLLDDGGRETFRLAMAAYLAGKKVDWEGSNSCTAHSNKEDITTIYVHD